MKKVCCNGFDWLLKLTVRISQMENPVELHRLKLLGQEPVFCKS